MGKNAFSNTKKLTFCAVGAAVSAVCVFLTNILPLSVSLLMFAALVYYIVFIKCGFVYGLIDIAASLLLTFFTGGISVLSSAFLLTAIIFAPYAILCFFMQKVQYVKPISAVIRIAVIAAFANIGLVIIWQLMQFITGVDILKVSEMLGGYAVLAIVFTILTIIFDFLFLQLSARLAKLIK